MNVLVLGYYDPTYPRNATIIGALRSNGIHIIEARVSLNRLTRPFALIFHLIKIGFEGLKIDLILVPMIDLETFPIAKFAAKLFEVPIVYDAFESRYSVWVREQNHSSTEIKSRILRMLEGYAVGHSDLVLCDTKVHGGLFAEIYGIKLEKLLVVYVCLDKRFFSPNFIKPDANKFVVQFVGYFHALAGVDTILYAASLLNDDSSIVFEVIGGRDQQKKERLQKKALELGLANMRFYDPVPYVHLCETIQRADICLGIFGNTDQSGRVIPNKVYQALAMGKAVVTRDSEAIREIFTPDVHIYVVPANDPNSLAEAITYIKQNPAIRTILAKNGHERFLEICCQKRLGSDLAVAFNKLIYH